MAIPHPHERINELAELLDDLVFMLLTKTDALDLSAANLERIRWKLTELKEQGSAL